MKMENLKMIKINFDLYDLRYYPIIVESSLTDEEIKEIVKKSSDELEVHMELTDSYEDSPDDYFDRLTEILKGKIKVIELPEISINF